MTVPKWRCVKFVWIWNHYHCLLFFSVFVILPFPSKPRSLNFNFVYNWNTILANHLELIFCFIIIKGGAPSCPPSAPNCPFHQMRCLPFTYQPHRLCNMGKPHCPWFTKNRNDIWDNPGEFNQGENRPQNNWTVDIVLTTILLKNSDYGMRTSNV